MIDGHSDATGCAQNTTTNSWRQFAHWATHVGDVIVDSEVGVAERSASEAIGLAISIRELEHVAHVPIWTDPALQ